MILDLFCINDPLENLTESWILLPGKMCPTFADGLSTLRDLNIPRLGTAAWSKSHYIPMTFQFLLVTIVVNVTYDF